MAPDGASVHPTSVVSQDANLGPGVTVGPFCVIHANVTVGEGSYVDSHSVLGAPTAEFYASPADYEPPPCRIGARTVINLLGRFLKPGQPVTLAIALRHTGADAGVLYDKDIKAKIDNDAETYDDPDGADYSLTVPAEAFSNTFEVFFKTFILRDDQAVPDDLNVFFWSEATNAAKSNVDYEVDWVTLTPGRAWMHYDPQAVTYSLTWNAGLGLYDIDQGAASGFKESAPSSDTGGAGEAAGGAGAIDNDDTSPA